MNEFVISWLEIPTNSFSHAKGPHITLKYVISGKAKYRKTKFSLPPLPSYHNNTSASYCKQNTPPHPLYYHHTCVIKHFADFHSFTLLTHNMTMIMMMMIMQHGCCCSCYCCRPHQKAFNISNINSFPFKISTLSISYCIQFKTRNVWRFHALILKTLCT